MDITDLLQSIIDYSGLTDCHQNSLCLSDIAIPYDEPDQTFTVKMHFYVCLEVHYQA